MCGAPLSIDARSLETRGPLRLGGALRMSAHPKVDEATGGPADRAGIKGGTTDDPASGDIIRAVDGQTVLRVADLVANIDARSVGAVVTVTVVRAGAEQAIQVTLGEYPEGR